MRDISAKQITLRTAKAFGLVAFGAETLQLIKDDALPKGNPFDFAKAAAMLGAKQTPNLIPHCHPVSIDGLSVDFKLIEPADMVEEIGQSGFNAIAIYCEGKSIGRTGIEMEALTAVATAALTIYDLLKPVDKGIEIRNVKLLDKKGGKTDKQKYVKMPKTAAVLVCSDSTAAGQREDKSGLIIKKMLEENNTEVVDYRIVPDDRDAIQACIQEWVLQDVGFIFTTGGTGLGPRDNTVAIVSELIDKEAPGITEAIRTYGGMRTPMAMMSRSVAGSIKDTFVVTLPGSSNGARESMDAILPHIFHARKMLKGGGH